MKSLTKALLSVALLGSFVGAEVIAETEAKAKPKFPLRVSIDVSTKRTKRNIGAGSDGEAKIEQVQVIVRIRKSGGQPWTEPVSAELYVIGKQVQTGYYGIIDVQKGTGTFSKENDNTFEYKSPFYSLGRTTGNINVGGSYETYLVVVTDAEGKIIDTRSGRSISDKGIALIREMGPMTLFDRDGNIVGKADATGAAFKAAIPSATNPGDNN
jgi:hypothetical protein